MCEKRVRSRRRAAARALSRYLSNQRTGRQSRSGRNRRTSSAGACAGVWGRVREKARGQKEKEKESVGKEGGRSKETKKKKTHRVLSCKRARPTSRRCGTSLSPRP